MDWRSYLAKDSQAWGSYLTSLQAQADLAEREALRLLLLGKVEEAKAEASKAWAFNHMVQMMMNYQREEQEYLLYMNPGQGEADELVVA